VIKCNPDIIEGRTKRTSKKGEKLNEEKMCPPAGVPGTTEMSTRERINIGKIDHYRRKEAITDDASNWEVRLGEEKNNR